MTTPAAEFKLLLSELRYAQMRTRIDIWALKRSKAKCKEIGDKMRQLQKQGCRKKTKRR